MHDAFPGFPRAFFVFLEDLAENNNKAWFHEHKAQYETQVVKPVMQFIEAVGQFLPNISDAYLAQTKRVGGSMFRIYRDTRFSNDKRPYKENVGCRFRHTASKDAHAPGFYVNLSPGEVFIGAGVWTPKNPTLDSIRSAIVQSPERWSAIVDDVTFKTYFGALKGESLKRAPRGYDANHAHVEDLKHKSFIVSKSVDPALALTDAFIDAVETTFNTASPLLRFLARALDMAE